MRDSIRLRRGAAWDEAVIEVGGRRITVFLDRLSRDEKSKLAIELWNWKRNGYIGYPVLT